MRSFDLHRGKCVTRSGGSCFRDRPHTTRASGLRHGERIARVSVNRLVERPLRQTRRWLERDDAPRAGLGGIVRRREGSKVDFDVLRPHHANERHARIPTRHPPGSVRGCGWRGNARSSPDRRPGSDGRSRSRSRRRARRSWSPAATPSAAPPSSPRSRPRAGPATSSPPTCTTKRACTGLVDEAAADRLGGLTVLVNNAAGRRRARRHRSPTSPPRRGMRSCASTSPRRCGAPAPRSRTCAPPGHGVDRQHLDAARPSAPSPGLAAYVAAKAGLNGLTRAIAVEEAAHGIRCNTISPGYVLNDRRDADLAPDRRTRARRHAPDPAR